MTDPVPSGPVGCAALHLARLAAPFAGTRAADLASAGLASARPAWPVWPHLPLASLIGPPPVVVERIDLRWLHRLETTVAWLDALGAAVGGPVGGPSALSLLVERAAMLGHRTWGPISAGGSARLVAAADGWVAVNLPREDDLAAVAAWLEVADDAGPWELVDRHVRDRPVATLIERATWLGLPIGVVPAFDTTGAPRPAETPIVALDMAGECTAATRAPVVVDLSSLWAGPLTGWYLARTGARVLKVESTRRPDGARTGTPAFWRRLNAGKELVELDPETGDGMRELRSLVAAADIVIEASRPRALERFGIDAAAEVARGAIWCSITGYGRASPRVAFGDDAAVAGGLVAHPGGTDVAPWFVGDAAADPISGVTAAAHVLALWVSGRAALVDVAMVDAVAAVTGGRAVHIETGPRVER